MSTATLARAVVDAAATLTGTIAHHGKPGVPRAAGLDLARYLGSWRVIAAIPLAPERGAFNPVETYEAGDAEGRIAVRYEFRRGGFEGPVETRRMVAEVKPGTGGAEWGVRLLGPLSAQYVIAFVEPDYSAAIVARDARDHVWILARESALGTERLERYRLMVLDMGYDESALVYFPQSQKQGHTLS